MKRENIPALLIGMWALTQINIIGFLGISELVMYLYAPFVLRHNWSLFKKDGLGTLFILLFLTMLSCIVSGLYNHCSPTAIIKGLATIYGLFAAITVIYPILRNDPDNLKWILIGLALSSVICVFIFQPGSAHVDGMSDRNSLQASVMGYPLFWIQQISTWCTLPIKIAYLHVPMWYMIGTPTALALYALISTASGRSTFLVMMFGVMLIYMTRTLSSNLLQRKKRFTIIVILVCTAGVCFATAYKYAAKQGLLGENAKIKYEKQVLNSGRGEGILAIIMGGRLEFFIGATACLKHPLLGCGPHAEDKEGLINYFFSKYGTYEDLEMLEKKRKMDALAGIYYQTIPAHSHIITFWLWYGIVGGIFWVYILLIFFQTLRNYFDAIPQWCGYLALILPSATLAIFFSPFGDRVMKGILVCVCFIVKNVTEGKLTLPQVMNDEIQAYKRRLLHR